MRQKQLGADVDAVIQVATFSRADLSGRGASPHEREVLSSGSGDDYRSFSTHDYRANFPARYFLTSEEGRGSLNTQGQEKKKKKRFFFSNTACLDFFQRLCVRIYDHTTSQETNPLA